MTRSDCHLTNRPLRALVLDPDAAVVERVRHALAARRFSVSSGHDGATGLDLLLGELLDLDVLVLDADLPGRDARSFAALVRGAGGERDLAIVVVAGEATRAARAGLLALGVDAVVERSAGPAAVAEAALAAVAARRAEPSRAREALPPVLELELEEPPARTALWALPFERLALLAS